MIKKIFLQSIVSAMLFLIVLFSFSRVDWLSVFDLRETVIEEKLGDMYWDLYSGSAVFLESDTVLAPLDSLLSHLCEANDIERDKIKLHVVQSNEVNAFAFPDNHLVVFTSLIAKCENQEELCGVMAHEIAHMQKGHIMKKLVKEVGLSALVGMASGGDPCTGVGRLHPLPLCGCAADPPRPAADRGGKRRRAAGADARRPPV